MTELLPKGFVERERSRCFLPDASFPKRVLARIRPVNPSAPAIWEFIPGFARPMIAVMTMVLVFMLGVQFFYSEPPEAAGIVDAYLEAEETPADQWIYHGVELPADDDLLLEISLAGSLQ